MGRRKAVRLRTFSFPDLKKATPGQPSRARVVVLRVLRVLRVLVGYNCLVINYLKGVSTTDMGWMDYRYGVSRLQIWGTEKEGIACIDYRYGVVASIDYKISFIA